MRAERDPGDPASSHLHTLRDTSRKAGSAPFSAEERASLDLSAASLREAVHQLKHAPLQVSVYLGAREADRVDASRSEESVARSIVGSLFFRLVEVLPVDLKREGLSSVINHEIHPIPSSILVENPALRSEEQFSLRQCVVDG
jgi:hypothetical protein